MLLSLIMRPLLHPLTDQLCLFRALATGGRIPGTNLILLPAAAVAATRTRFGRIEQLMMVLAGGWLLFRVICCKLADEDYNSKTTNCSSNSSSRNTSELDMEMDVEDVENSEQKSRMSTEEEQIYWQGHKHYGGLQPMLRFTRHQLDALLRLEEEDESETDTATETDADSEYLDMSDDGMEEERIDCRYPTVRNGRCQQPDEE
ncbi:hypothetical protein KR093_007114 [Drosophila rubida]|uniref:Uncharacterized protein n=1 Tax=Drosophila rubida TaxID=30044 RepID=A0AAD4KAR3_9MUSC|nr:hypothetical protein KR093_007114 [Drosophila rubida]